MGGQGSGRPEPAKRDTGGRYGKEGCFVATAVYGSYDAPEVLLLRRFRDDALRKTAFGRGFIAVYYRVSPSVAKRLAAAPRLAAWCRTMLNVFVRRHL